jgi:hypothetical protein
MRSAILTFALVLLAAAPAAAQQDLRMPDTRDAADRSTQWIAPDTGLPGYPTPSDPPRGNQDLRSPDTRDAAAGRSTSVAPQVTVVKLPQPAPAPAGGIDWADAGMGAAIVLVLSAAGLVAVVVRRRAHPQTAISA